MDKNSEWLPAVPVSAPLILGEGDRDRIEASVDPIATSRDSVVRAQIVLLAADGHSNTAIAKELGISRPTVISWRARYAEHGIDGLVDGPKPGRPRVVEPHAIVATLLAPPPARYEVTHWNSRLLAQHLQVGKTTMQAAWKEYGVKPYGPDRFTFATVPPFAATVTAVIDLHIGTEGNAIVLAVASKPGRPEQTRRIHSAVHLDQFHRYLGRRARLLATDSRIATGSTFDQHSRPDEDITAFCHRSAATYPNERVHVIFDADTSQLEPVRSTLAVHRHVRTHHTLTPTGWLHLVDTWFAIADRRVTQQQIANQTPPPVLREQD
ncbi:helix-turn-helix domain-containing protein [Rhodococcus globerulus]|uniref:Helix-turn-helix domain-containing protein n=1 Tax=Rhodococcus globerulus TaxID=33008 RepID=A0ABU4C523_RHOGO|nr:helix-turn-helix domain-containing protein [Rhodococcus globerulus]MDV6271298.1 helix-turn-helix domain-containing protein [Rhodococcus globerulus]